MGLDLIEIVMAIEEESGIDLPDSEARRLTTPALVIDYVYKRLTIADSGATTTAVRWTRRDVANLVRRVAIEQLGLSPSEYREDAEWVRDLGAG